jgi:hypothetical protein
MINNLTVELNEMRLIIDYLSKTIKISNDKIFLKLKINKHVYE